MGLILTFEYERSPNIQFFFHTSQILVFNIFLIHTNLVCIRLQVDFFLIYGRCKPDIGIGLKHI
jgi:hypothetical protein